MPATDNGLYRNWKGYLVWASTCRNADGGDGYAVLILTGPRAGEREWRSARSWLGSPHVAPGLPRYERVTDPLPWCPLTQALSVYREEFPDAPAVPILWDPGHDIPGACYYRSHRDHTPTKIIIDPHLSLTAAVEVLLHELAHAAVTPAIEEEEHGPRFQAALDRLLVAYRRRCELKLQIPGMTRVRRKDDDV